MATQAPSVHPPSARDTDLRRDSLRLERYLSGEYGGLQTRVRVPTVHTLGDRDVLGALPAGPEAAPAAPGILLTPGSVLFGPTHLTAARSPCSQCLALRWQKLRTEPERDVLEGGGQLLAVGPSPHLTPFAMEAVRQLITLLSQSVGGGTPDAPADGIARVHELTLATLAVRSFPLIADPACNSCSSPRRDTDMGARPELVGQRKPAPDRYRLRPVAELHLPVEAYVNPVCGLLGASASADLASDTTAPVAGHIMTRSFGRLSNMNWSGHADSYDDSRTLAVLEGLERYASSQQRRFAATIVDTLDNLSGQALDPRECGVYADQLYRSDPYLRPFAPDQPIPWVWGWSLRDGRAVLVPERIAYYMARGAGDNFVHECSNGCAGGSCMEEAMLHGLLELIERDAFLLGWYGRAVLPEIDTDSCRSLATRSMIDRIRMSGYDVRLFDNRVDLPVPAVTAVAVRQDGGPGTLCFAAGASLDPDDAVRAALCEIGSYVPSLPTRVAHRRADLDAMVQDFSKVTELADHAVLFGHPEMARHAEFLLGERPTVAMPELYRGWDSERPRTLDLMDDLDHCRHALVAAGFDVIVVDQTSPEQQLVGLHTACMIVPGLLPIDFGWHKQRALHMPRMRTAFRQAGWRDTDLTEADLHRVPHPFP